MEIYIRERKERKKMLTIKKLIEHLSGYDDDLVVAYSLWQPVDVIQRAKQRGLKLTREEAEIILSEIGRKQGEDYKQFWLDTLCTQNDYQ